MSAEKDFAESLAGALGPLYQVSIVGAGGEVEARFGEIHSERTSRAEIPLPKTTKLLRVEVDVDAVEAAQRVVVALAPGQSSTLSSAGFTHVDRAIHQLISMAETRIGISLSEMSRQQKQQVVRFLDERGAFNLRKSVETVADKLGVSRFTVYNYLDSSRGS